MTSAFHSPLAAHQTYPQATRPWISTVQKSHTMALLVPAPADSLLETNTEIPSLRRRMRMARVDHLWTVSVSEVEVDQDLVLVIVAAVATVPQGVVVMARTDLGPREVDMARPAVAATALPKAAEDTGPHQEVMVVPGCEADDLLHLHRATSRDLTTGEALLLKSTTRTVPDTRHPALHQPRVMPCPI